MTDAFFVTDPLVRRLRQGIEGTPEGIQDAEAAMDAAALAIENLTNEIIGLRNELNEARQPSP
jgi:hypothetical protein